MLIKGAPGQHWVQIMTLRLTSGKAIPEPMLTLIARLMGSPSGPPGADRTQVDPMLATWTLLSGDLMTIEPWGTNFSEIWIKKTNIFIKENESDDVVCKTAAILFMRNCGTYFGISLLCPHSSPWNIYHISLAPLCHNDGTCYPTAHTCLKIIIIMYLQKTKLYCCVSRLRVLESTSVAV